MPANDAANLISEHAEVHADAILSAMNQGRSAKIRFMLGYAENAVAYQASLLFANNKITTLRAALTGNR